jgi:carbon-monoxide dehydrogenase medium subunit
LACDEQLKRPYFWKHFIFWKINHQNFTKMIPHSFDYKRASSVEEAIEILQNGSYAKVLGGGHSLVPALKLRLNAPETLVDVTRIESLKGIAIEDGTLVIGAANTHHEIATSADVQISLFG